MDVPFRSDPCLEFEIIGEHRADPLRLLAVDADGRLFDLNLASGDVAPVELTGDWRVDTVAAHRARRTDALVPPVLVVG